MKSDNEIRQELDDILTQRNRIQKELDDVQAKLKVFEDSMYFNVCDITKILAKLVSNKEKDSYYPVFYDDRNLGHHFDAALNFAIVRAEDEEQAYRKFSNFYNNESVSFDGQEPILIGTVYYIYCTKVGKVRDPYKVDIAFKALLSEYNVADILSKEGICLYNFKDYQYINYFIKYLYILQVQNNGKHLTYEKMQVALNDFLSKEKDKPKQKIKEKNKQS